MLCLYTISHLRKTMSVLISKVNNSVKFIIALGIFALFLSFSNHVVKADTYYPTYVRGWSSGYNVGSNYYLSPVSSTDSYISYNLLASYPYLYFLYDCNEDCVLNSLFNFSDVNSGGTYYFAYNTGSSWESSSLSKGTVYTFTAYDSNVYSVCCVGDTVTVTSYGVSSSSFLAYFIYSDTFTSGDFVSYNSYYLSSDSSSSSTDYTSLLSSIYNQLVALNTDSDTMVSYLNTIINNLVSLNADTDTIISELNTIESLIGSTSDSGTILYYLYQISTYTSYTPNIYSLLNAWYQDLVSESEDTSIDEEIESDLAVVEAEVGDSVSAASSSQSDMLSADSDVDDSIQSGFDDFDSNIDSITDNISFSSGTGLYSSLGIFSLLFSDVFGISEINTYLYILLFLGIIGTVFGVATKVIGKRGDSGD